MRSSFSSGILLLLLVFVQGCDDGPDMEPMVESTVALSEIYNLDSNSFRIYHVIDTTFENTGPVVEEYYKKEEIIGTTTDLEGRMLYLIQRSRAQVGSFAFEPESVWSLFIPEDIQLHPFIERQENNIRFLDLTYPVAEGVRWDGNLYNTQRETIYRYLSTDTTLILESGTFDNSIFVLEKLDTTSIITQTFAYSIYSPGIGHIARYDKTIITDGPNQEFNPDESRVYQEKLILFQ